VRKLFCQMNVTLDGFMEGPNRDLTHTAHVVDQDFDRYATEMLKSIDAFVIGRRTYELFVDFWAKATGPDADRLNELSKIVFSRTLKTVEWENARLVGSDIAEEIIRLTRQPGKDIALFGSADLTSSFIRLGLIDEYRIFVTPVVLGVGSPMFKNIQPRINLKLMNATTWSSGMVAPTGLKRMQTSNETQQRQTRQTASTAKTRASLGLICFQRSLRRCRCCWPQLPFRNFKTLIIEKETQR
jgi:dihydrofolate reductase